MANLGFQLIYATLNQIPGVCCHRAFAQDNAGNQRVTPKLPVPVTLESGESISRYDVIALAFNYENNVLNAYRMLHAAGITLESSRRHHREPLIIAGGVVATINPEPFADLLDICVLGEAEELLPELCDILAETWKINRDRAATLEAVSLIPGVYLPSWYTAVYNSRNRFQQINQIKGHTVKLTRRLVSDLDAVPASTVIHTPHTEFPEIHLVEVSRGCPRACRFCLIPGCYRPFRHRSIDAVISAAVKAPPGWRIGLLGAGVADHPDLYEICTRLASLGYSFSFSSLHASSITPQLSAVIRENGPRTITLAPEAGSDQRRLKLGKTITNKTILDAIFHTARDPVKSVKAYFMVGLPGETNDDLDSIAELCRGMENTLRHANQNMTTIPRITAGISCFVPKAQSAFERAPLCTDRALKKKLSRVTRELKKIQELQWNHDNPRLAVVQGLIARGDRRLGPWFIEASRPGADWRALLRSDLINVRDILPVDEKLSGPLPWDHLRHLVY